MGRAFAEAPLAGTYPGVICIAPRMAEARIVNELECSESMFWDRLFFDGEFNRRLFLEELKFVGWRVLRQADVGGDVVERELEVMPPVGDLPSPLRAVIGEGLSYREVGRFDKNRRRYTVKAISPKLGDRLLVEGELYTEATSERTCRRIFAVRVVAKIFGVGGMVESRVVADLERSYAASARFIGRYVKELS
jgi:Protein of unknown function (DUF2505)